MPRRFHLSNNLNLMRNGCNGNTASLISWIFAGSNPAPATRSARGSIWRTTRLGTEVMQVRILPRRPNKAKEQP